MVSLVVDVCVLRMGEMAVMESWLGVVWSGCGVKWWW